MGHFNRNFPVEHDCDGVVNEMSSNLRQKYF